MAQSNHHLDPDDYFSETRMSFGDHIEDLRTHLWRAIKGFFVAILIAFPIGWYVLDFIAKPVEIELGKFHDKRMKKIKDKLYDDHERFAELNEPKLIKATISRSVLEELLGKKFPDDFPHLNAEKDGVTLPLWLRPFDLTGIVEKALKELTPRPTLRTMGVQEAFMVYVKVSLVTGFVLASPWIFFQIWSFVAAGMYPHEKKYINVYLPVSLGLFLVGVVVCELVVIPKAVEALLWFNEWLGFEPDLRLNEWLGFAILMPVVFGISFQTPLVMLFMERIGVGTVEAYRAKRKISWFLMAIFAAVITPSVDLSGMLFLWVPMTLLYELGIGLCLLSPRRPVFDLDVPEPEDMVEV
jgi:sec-independent protein translocase protein TatC